MATLTFNEFIGGSNVLDLRTAYPTSRGKLSINFGQDITNWTFSADYQTLIIDPVAYDRSGVANFTDSAVLGSFPKTDMAGGDVPVVVDAATGDVSYVLPETMYTGPMFPKGRVKVPIVVVGCTFTDPDGNIETIRVPILMAYEPDVVVGDPTLEVDYTAVAGA